MRLGNIESLCKGKIKKTESYKLKTNSAINASHYEIMFERLRGESLSVC